MSQNSRTLSGKFLHVKVCHPKILDFLGHWNTHKTNLRLHILYFGERTSDNHPSYLDYHVSSRLRQLCIYLRNIPHENPSSFSRSTFSALSCLEKTSTIVAFAFWVTFYQHPFLLKFSPFLHVCFPAYNPYVTTILNDN